MSLVPRTKTALQYAVSFVLYFAQGGLVVVGGLAAALLLMGLAKPAGVLEPLSDPLAHLMPGLFSADTDGAVAAKVTLTAEQRKVADYIARRYRVAGPAIDRLVAETYAVAPQHGVEPLLLLAVMAVESGFNPIAESVFGAQGLMQVIPKFHPEKLANEGEGASLLDPVTNIRVGAQVIREYVKSEGSLQAGLQKYAGAALDPYAGYTAKVFAERQRLYQVVGRRVPAPVAVVVQPHPPGQDAQPVADAGLAMGSGSALAQAVAQEPTQPLNAVY